MQRLVTNGVDLNTKGADGFTPLHWLVLMSHIKGVKSLLAMGAMPDVQDERGMTPLWIAAAAGYHQLAFFLMEHRANPDMAGPGGLTPLMIASANGHRDAVFVLMRAGTNLDNQDDAGSTALVYAVKSGNQDIVQSLLDAGANRFLQDKHGLTAMAHARVRLEREPSQAATAMVALLRVKARDIYPDENVQKIASAIEAHDLAQVKQLLGNTPIDPNVTGLDGMTLLAWAILQDHWEALDALLSKGANPIQGDDAGTSATHLAAEHADRRYLQTILQRQPNLAVRNSAGWTPLAVAIRARREQNALALLDHDAHPNLQDALGLSPLHHAVLVRSDVMVAALLKKGADRALTDDEGHTALDYAQAIEAKHLADLLVGK